MSAERDGAGWSVNQHEINDAVAPAMQKHNDRLFKLVNYVTKHTQDRILDGQP